jgi:hypothetical protein
MLFDFKQITNNSIDMVIESKTNDPVMHHCIGVQKTLMKFSSKTCHMKFLSFSHKCKISCTFFIHNKVYHNKLILIIFTQ